MDTRDQFIKQIEENLKGNGFPERKVSLPHCLLLRCGEHRWQQAWFGDHNSPMQVDSRHQIFNVFYTI